MDEEIESDHIDVDFYAQLESELFDGEEDSDEEEEPDVEAESSLASSTARSESVAFTASSSAGGGESIADDGYVCTCPWLVLDPDQAAVGGEDDAGDALSPTPSDLLYDELVHRDYVCKGSQESSSIDSRYTPESTVDGEPAHMVPFSIKWSFGFAIKSILINFTTDSRKEFYIPTAHKGNIYNYETNGMRYVHGHVKPVRSVSADASGQWLVSGGYGYHSKIIVTDSIKCKQLLILDNPVDDIGSLLLGMAPDARFFISVHNIEQPRLKFFKWTYGNQDPDYIHEIGQRHIGRPCRIKFHPNDQNFITIVFEKLLFLAHWNEDKDILENIVHVNAYRKIGPITDCEVATNRHEVFASTSSGHIAIFANKLYTENIREHELNTTKMYVKKIKVARSGIKSMLCPDNIICTLEEKGTLKFFDTNILLLYWIESELPPIKAVSFSLNSIRTIKKNRMSMKLPVPSYYEVVTQINHENINMDEEDRVLDYDMLLKQGVRSRASLLHRPFIVRDFMAGCQDGRIFHVDIVHDIYQPYFSIADSPVVSICVSTVHSFLFVAYESGRISMFNYDTMVCVLTSTVLVKQKRRRRKIEEEPTYVVCNSYILISHIDIHLVLARTNGAIMFLDPTMVPIPDQYYKFTSLNILHMAFSENNQYLAFCDLDRTMIVVRHHEEKWMIHMKFRGHTEPITDLLFLHFETPRLYTIGEDRYMIEYSLDEADIDQPMKSRVKIEDTAIPLCFLYYPTAPTEEKYFLIANNEYKYKLINETTMKCRSLTVGPHQGCYEKPISRMIVLPNSHGKYSIFQNNNHMGIQKTPPDGSPYKHIGILANPQLGSISICNQGKYVFTYARGEGGVLIWTINTTSLDMLHYMGGPELEPFYCLIEGGANGWFFKEIEDLFCYMQILHQEDAYSSQAFGDSIFIADLPDLIRACGFYPSEYELEQLVYEITYKDFDKTGELRVTITFIEFVKIFLNHRPAYGVSLEEMEHHFTVLLNGREDFTPHEFAKKMCKYGEPFTEETLSSCVSNLMSNETLTYDTDVLNRLEPITFEYLSKTMLGILQESAYAEAQERAIREAEENEL